MIDFLRTAVGLAGDTAAYLMAWWAVPAWALAGAVFLQLLARDWPLEGWIRAERPSRRLAGAFLLAVARPFGRSTLHRNLERLDRHPAATAAYLAAGHGLTLYYFALLGPLLGKDVLLSHVLGMVAFAGFAAGFAVLLGTVGCPGPAGDLDRGASGGFDTTAANDPTAGGGATGAGRSPRGWRSLLVGEGERFLGWSLWGLAVGGLVGAAGLSSPSLLLTDLLPGDGLPRQIVHAGVGLLAAPASFMWPVATLFAGTFLWKVGLAHAGLVTFFCAATLSPQRVRSYREVWGTGKATRWAVALALAALSAGLLVAVLFGLTGLEIRYKLMPGQLWRP